RNAVRRMLHCWQVAKIPSLLTEGKAARSADGVVVLSRGSRVLALNWQVDDEGGVCAQPIQLDVTTVVLDDLARNAETDTGARAGRLGGEERLKDVLARRRRNSRPAVGY